MKIDVYNNDLNLIKKLYAEKSAFLVCYFDNLKILSEKKMFLTYEFQILKNSLKIPFFVVFNGLNEVDTEIAKFLGIRNKKSAFFYIINNKIKNIEIDLNNINIDTVKKFL